MLRVLFAEQFRDGLQVLRVCVVKDGELFGIGVQYAPDVAVCGVERDDDFRLRARGAGDVVGVGVDVRHDQGFALRPCLAADAAPFGYACAGERSLKGAEYEFRAAHEVKAYSEPAEGFFEDGGGVGEVGGEVAFRADDGFDLRQDFGVAAAFVAGGEVQFVHVGSGVVGWGRIVCGLSCVVNMIFMMFFTATSASWW